MLKENQHISFEEVLSKLLRFCDYQSRSEQEVYQKAKDLTSNEETISDAMDFLKKEGYLDDQKFAAAFVRGKMKQKKWGRYKLKQALIQKRVLPSIIDTALKNIDQEEYIENLQTLIVKRNQSQKIEGEERVKLYRFLLSKGYESSLILELLS